MVNTFVKMVLVAPRRILGFVTGITLFFAYFIPQLSLDFSLEQLFPEHDPDRTEYFEFREEFSLDDDTILMVYECDDPFSMENLDLLRDLTYELEYLEGVESVISLTNIERLWQEDGVLYVELYFDENVEEVDIETRKNELIIHPVYRNTIISPDGKYGAIMVNVDDEYNTHDARLELITALDDLRAASPWEWHDAGVPVLRTAYVVIMKRERNIFLPIAIVIALIVLYGMFRQVNAVVFPIIAIIMGLIWVAGIMALLGIQINVVSYLTFNLLLIVGVSDGIHIITKYYGQLSRGLSKRDAIYEVLHRIGTALFLTSFTTATGFFSLIITNIRIIQEFGLLMAGGVMIIFAITITIIPALLLMAKEPESHIIKNYHGGRNFLLANGLTKMNERHPRKILLATALIFTLSLYGTTRLDTDAALMDDLRPGNVVYDDIAFAEDHMGSILPLEVVVDTGKPDGILAPEFLRSVQNLQIEMERHQHIGSTLSIVNFILTLNEGIGAGEQTIPESDTEIAELLDLANVSNVSNMVNADFSKVRISARVNNINYADILAVKSLILDWCETNLPVDYDVTVTGTTLLALKTNDTLVKSLAYSFIVAFAVIFFSLALLFKSLKLAVISIIPNLLPLLAAAGFMGLTGIKLRPTTAMIFAVAFGIAVDDTIHFLARFRQEFHKNGGHYRPAIALTLLTTGRAIISTTVVLMFGFSVLMFSDFVPQFQFGLLASLILLVALLSSITLLPVLIALSRPKLTQ